MILSKDIKPDRQIYNIGACLLEVLQSNQEKELDFLDVFKRVKIKNNVSFNTYMLALDWLFLLGAIESKEGRIRKCF
jgi:hypothetical protein